MAHRNDRWTRPVVQILILTAIAVLLGGLPTGCSGKSKAEKLRVQGSILYRNLKYYQAIDKFEESLKLDPNQTAALDELADAYLKTDKPELAIKIAEKSVALNPKNANGWLLQGQAHLTLAQRKATGGTESTPPRPDQAELDKAAEITSRLRQQQPDALEGMLLQARIDQINNRPTAAEKLFRQSLKQAPKNSTAQLGLAEILLARKAYTEAETLMRQAIAASTPPNPGLIDRLALSLAFQNKLDAAFDVLEPYVTDIKKAPPEMSHYLLAARVLLTKLEKTGDGATSGTTAKAAPAKPFERERDIKRLAALGGLMKGVYPTLPDSWFYRAVSYQLQGNLPAAIEHMQQACLRENRPIQARQYRLALARLHVQNKAYATARQELRMLLKAVPGDIEAQLFMGQCYAMEGSFDESLELLRGLQLERPKDKAVQETLGRVLVQSGVPENVEKGMVLLGGTSAGANQPGSKELAAAQAVLRQAEAKRAAGDYQQADQIFQQAERQFQEITRLYPNNTLGELKLAELAGRRNDMFTALDHVSRAARIDPQYLSAKAQLLMRVGQLPAARQIYEQLLKAQPDALGYQFALATVEVQMGQSEAAQKIYDALIQKHADDPRAYLRRAGLIGRREGPEAAARALKEAQKRFPEDLDLRLALAQVYLRLQKPAEAALALGELTQKMQAKLAALPNIKTPAQTGQPNATAVSQSNRTLASFYQQLSLAKLLDGKGAEASAHAAQIAKLDPSQANLGRIITAIAELREGQAAQATETLKQIPADGAGIPPTLPLLRSLAWVAAGDMKQAQAAVEKQSHLNTNTLILYNRMLVQLPKAQAPQVASELALQILLSMYSDLNDSALMVSERAVALLPRDPFTLSRKAEALQATGRVVEAVAVYETIRRVIPDFAPVLLAQCDLHGALAELAMRHGDAAKARQEKAEAIRLCRLYLDKQRKNPDALKKLAALVQEDGQIEEANKLYRQAISIDPNNWSAYNNLAWNLVEANQFAEAAVMGEKALKLATDVGGVQDTLGWIEFKRGNFDRALDLLSKASLRLPNNADVRFHRAQALLKKGQTVEARRELELIAQASPDSKLVNQVQAMLRQLAPESVVPTSSNDTSSTTSHAATGKP